MTLKDIARRIPHSQRKMLLDENHIFKAIAKIEDMDMQVLFIMCANFVMPNDDRFKYTRSDNGIIINTHCNICIGDCHKKMTDLLPYLVELEKEYNLIESQ